LLRGLNILFPINSGSGQLPIAICQLLALPGRLHDPGNLTLERQAAEAQTAQAEFPQESARPSADGATVPVLGRELGFFVRLGDFRCSCHLFLVSN
jgi:hypothetical protein